MESRNTGREKMTLIHKRLCISATSLAKPSPAVGTSGSNAIPHLGQAPGPIFETPGHMGQM
jgi:hypothetical protein